MAEELAPRERVRLALSHQPTDRVPITFVCAELEPPARADLAKYLGVSVGEGVDRYLEQYVDLVTVGPNALGSDSFYRGPKLDSLALAYEDIWGVRWERASEALPVGIRHFPLADANAPSDLHRHRWPDADWWDYSRLSEEITRVTERREYALIMTSGNLFERTCWMRGFERALFDMMDNSELFHAIMERVTDFYVEQAKRTLAAAAGRIDLAFTADDIAGQEGLLLSIAMWEKHIKPYHRRLNDVLHSLGVKVVYHSDGNVMSAVPGLLDQGVDVLQALQFSARGMDPVALKQAYGERLCFEGGISVQTTLPFGTAAEVRREVEERIAVLGRGGGYLLSPSHTIMPGTPPENVVAMLETAASTPVPSA